MSKKGGLKKWFQEKWVDIGARKKDGSYQECGRKSASSSKRKYPKCVPLAKAQTMSASQKASAVKRKRAARNTGPKPTNVRTAFAGGLIPNPSQSIAMAQQASPQDYVQYKMSGELQASTKPAEQKYQAVKAPVEEVKVEEKSGGGLMYTKPTQKNYYGNLI